MHTKQKIGQTTAVVTYRQDWLVLAVGTGTLSKLVIQVFLLLESIYKA
jgi:hypothetical protein